MRVLAVADDLTGALEAGAKFAQAGLEPVVAVGCAPEDDAHGVVVLDTETRHAAADEAERVVLMRAPATAELVYKKTDSTLRGNIGAELRALARLYPGARTAYVPAYPALGRTVRDGILYVHGERVDRTAFARDSLNPVLSARVDSVLPADLDCDIFDGETDEDVARMAQRIVAGGEYRIIAGPAAIAGQIAALLGSGPAVEPWPRVQSCLVVNGSQHPVSAAQVGFGTKWPVMVPDVEPGTPELECARRTGCRVRTVLDETNPDALVVFGGDTVFGILTALGTPLLRPIGEILPGAPASRIDGRRTILITKAGGFGDVAILRQLEEQLNG